MSHSRAPLWLLALLTIGATAAIHLLSPALPAASAELGVDPSTIQLAVSLYMIGLAIGQLFYGPISDRYGRRPVLIVGLLIYVIAGLATVLATSGPMLIAARFLQSLGGCAGLVLGRAIIRDTSNASEDAARRLALMTLMVAIVPGLGPLVGGLLETAFGWRSILFVLSALGTINLACAWFMLDETRPNTGLNTFTQLSRHYAHLLRSPVFLGYAVGGGCATSSIYSFIAAAPFIFTGELNRPTHEVGLFVAMVISGNWLGSLAANRLIGVLEIKKHLVRANLISVLGAFLLLIFTLAGELSVSTVLISMFCFSVGAGMASPAAASQAISVNPEIIGSAAGLYGFVQMVVGALTTILVGFGDDPALSVGIVLSCAGVIAQASFWRAMK